MSRDIRMHRSGCRSRPRVEGLEGRNLLSTTSLSPRHPAFDLPDPISAGEVAGMTSVALPHELSRSAFKGIFTGNYLTGPPQFTDQLSQTLIWGEKKKTWIANHPGYLAITVKTPQQIGSMPTITATLQAPGNGASAGYLVLDLTYLSPQPTPQERILPTLLKWTVSSSSTGIFTNATGSGLVQIVYGNGAADVVPGGTQKGFAAVEFSGLVFTDQTTKLFHPPGAAP